ncbi:MAG: hypothetical protein C4521_10600 [Actinobacteria bacterium]|nr:MAG: hypothetical protein C4521_10600 [Actinomycetota bacterium]
MEQFEKKWQMMMEQKTSRDMMKDYDESDMQVLFRRGQWQSWRQAIDWLESQGLDDNELTPGEVKHMLEDLQQLERENVSFSSDPMQAHSLAKQHRKKAA